MNATQGTPGDELVLIVDDDPRLLSLLSLTLRQNGFSVATATSGPEAIARARKLHPVAVLLDVSMEGGLSGYETCRLLKEEDATKDAAIIFMTGFAKTADKLQGFSMGAVDFVTKPFDNAELIARVRTHLTVQRLQRNLADANEKLSQAYETLRGVFGRFVSTEVVREVLEQPGGLDLGGQERDVTLMMSDLRGFTQLSERLAPKEVVAILNRYLERMLAVIDEAGGTVLEIVGDALFVLFGAPAAMRDHPERAVACALKMQLALDALNAETAETAEAEDGDMARPKGPQLEMGIGVHTGRVIVGNLGSAQRTKYGAVGLAANLAGRIETYTCGGQIFISEETAQRIRAPLTIGERETILPKGVESELRILEVTALGAPHDLVLPAREEAWEELAAPATLLWRTLEDKADNAPPQAARILRYHSRGAWLEHDHPPPRRANLRLSLPLDASADGQAPEDLYGKVTEVAARQFKVRWSSAAPSSLRMLANAAQTHRQVG